MKLRKLELKDAPLILEWMHDETINRFFQKDFAKFTVADIEKSITSSINDSNNIDFAVTNENDLYLGTVSLKNIDDANKNAEYAISFRNCGIGKGCAKFATDEILKIAFCDLKLERIYLNVLSENIRANKFYSKYGFIYEGEFKSHICIRDTLKDLKWYRILKDEYNERMNNNA